jgi:hypothetical protein
MKMGLFAIVMIAIAVNMTLAQLHMNTGSAPVGTDRTLFPGGSFYQEFQHPLYPEVQIGGDVVVPSLRWIASWGYWSDGVERALPVADLVTYSSHRHIIGFHVNFLPAMLLPHLPFSIGVFTGVSYHFIAGRYESSFDGRTGQDFTENVTTLEIGLNVNVQLVGPMAFHGEVLQFIPLGSEVFDRLQKNRRAFAVGVAFRL